MARSTSMLALALTCTGLRASMAQEASQERLLQPSEIVYDQHFLDQLKPRFDFYSNHDLAKKLDEQNQRTRRQKPQPGDSFLDGLFMTPCYPIYNQQGARYNLSMAQTLLFDHNSVGASTFFFDNTVYTGDIDCRPDLSDVFYKAMYRGEADFKVLSSTRVGIELVTSNSSFVLGSGYPNDQLDLLQKYCGETCNVKWSNYGDLTRVQANHCKNTNTLSKDSPAECFWSTGHHVYFQFSVNASGVSFTQGTFDVQAQGWDPKAPLENPAPYIPQTFNSNNSLVCQSVLTECSDYIKYAIEFCVACDESKPDAPKYDQYDLPYLECDGCLFRTAKSWMPNPNEQLYDKCCPCFALYGQKVPGVEYMKHINC